MSKIKENIESLTDDVRGYIETKVEAGKLDSIEKIVEVSSNAISWVVIGVVGFIALSLLTVIAGLALSHLFDSFIFGFGLLALFYLVIFAFCIIYRKSILEKRFMNILFGIFLKK